MGRQYDTLDGRLGEFILAQPVFFVATAPAGAAGHVNCSPKGNNGSLAVLGPRRLAYRDLTGSGSETIAHLRENGRIVVMFCAFEGPPRIIRVHGRGRVVTPEEPDWEEVAGRFAPNPGTRAVIVVEAERVSDSCGYAVPLMTFERHRDNLDHWAEQKGPEGLVAYREDNNAESLDGLPSLTAASAASTLGEK
ncbi:MAG: pyridoxamine 5'-phosphate oxidase family protein [Acidimicrobiales bacterium]